MKKVILFLLIQTFLACALVAQNPRNVLIYNLTSTNCGPCSCMDSILSRIVIPAFPNTVVLALHGIGSSFNKYQGDSVYNFFNSQYDPSGFMDGLGYDVYYDHVKDSVASRYLHYPETAVKIQVATKNWNPVTRKLDFTMNLTNLGAELPGKYRINVFVTEDNIKMTHRVAEGCAKPDDPGGLPLRNNYFNNWVTRSLVYYTKGDLLVGPNWPAQQMLTRPCSFSIDEAWIPENCNFTVVVYRDADSLYKANVQQVIRQSVTRGIGIPEIKPAQDAILSVYPNPSRGDVNIHFSNSEEGDCRLTIFSINGTEMENLLQGNVKPGFYNIETDTRKYAPGIYIALLTTPSGMRQTRFVVP